MNVAQNNIIRYMTGFSSHSQISQTSTILQMFNIFQLFVLMKLIYVKNVKMKSMLIGIIFH